MDPAVFGRLGIDVILREAAFLQLTIGWYKSGLDRRSTRNTPSELRRRPDHPIVHFSSARRKKNGQEAIHRETETAIGATAHRLRRGRLRSAAHAGTQGARAKRHHDLVTLQGPGVFLGAAVSKQGGTNDLTFVILDIDGRNVVNLSYAAAANQGLTEQNPYGLVLLQSAAIKTMTHGFPTPLLYKRSLRLRVTVNEPGVVQILANVVHGGA